MASPLGPPRFVRGESALADVLLGLKLACCPHCRRSGTLIGHGLLRGYAEQTSEMVVRWRRVLCSNRGQRPGCGRTFSVVLSTVLSGFVVRTLTLFRFASAVLGGWRVGARGWALPPARCRCRAATASGGGWCCRARWLMGERAS